MILKVGIDKRKDEAYNNEIRQFVKYSYYHVIII